MIASSRGRDLLVLLLVCAGALSACGKKGPPLPPLARVPGPPVKPQAARVGDAVYVWFGVPATNVSGETPADLSAIEVYAFTGVAPPPGPDPIRHAVKVGSYAVIPPLPPPPEPAEGAPPPPPPPAAFVQGATAVVVESLTPEALAPTPLSAAADGAAITDVDDGSPPLTPPLVAPSDEMPLKRFYYLVPIAGQGRPGSPPAPVSVPIERATAPPGGLRLAYTATGMTLAWTPSPEAHAAAAPADPALLTSKPLASVPPPTSYFVFEVPRAPVAANRYEVPLPTAVTQQPVAASELAIPGDVRFGVERCFVVRPVDRVAGTTSMGAASEPACVTPADTFPPAPPQRLAAIAGLDVINLIWEPNTDADLAGYIVLRGTAPGDTLQALTSTPIRETTYRDQSVRAGERYVYAVVAVDQAMPQNVSGQSNRVEESSRAPR